MKSPDATLASPHASVLIYGDFGYTAKREEVLYAAIRISGDFEYIGRQDLVFQVPRPLRHDSAILSAQASLRLTDNDFGSRVHEQGFVTSCGRFVGRAEGGKVAFAAGQISRETNCLTSEDLW